ncbi:Uncharacterized protein FKW44_010680, partial [Caligus rogercresseyi]
VVSILIHFFHTACFMFMFLESLHMYSIVASVVKRNGMLSKCQNLSLGWIIPAGITLITIGLQFENYGGEYHCWLRMDTHLAYAQIGPIAILMVMTFTLIEAAGVADYGSLKDADMSQLLSAKISQRTNLIIMPLVFTSFMLGTLSEYEQNLPLYAIFTIINGVLGAVVFFFHSTGNEQIRRKLSNLYAMVFKKD